MEPQVPSNSNPPTSNNSASRGPPEFLCPYCGDSFKRLEHLSRHKLSHSDDRPYQCPTCSKAFTRKDTLNRHIPIHASKPDGKLDRRSAVSRVSRACVRCARSRLRCDGENPCSRCSKKNTECSYPGRSRKRIAAGPRLLSSSASANDETPGINVQDGALPHQQRSKAPQSRYTGFQLLPQESVTDSEDDNGRGNTYDQAIDQSSGNYTPLSEHGTRQMTPTSTQQKAMPPPYDTLRSRSSSIRQFQNSFGDEQSDFGALQSPHGRILVSQLTTPTQTVDNISTRDRYQSATYFSDSGMWSKDSNPIAMDFSYSPPCDTTFELMDWMTYDPQRDFSNPFVTGLEPKTHSLLPYTESIPCVEQYSLPNLTDPNRYYYSDREWGRKSSVTTTEQNLSLQSSIPSSSFPTPGAHQFPIPTPAYQPKQETLDTPKPITEPAVPYRGKPPPRGEWPTDWEPNKSDNIVSFPDLSSIPLEILEAEEFGHVGNMSQQTYDEIVRCLKITTDQNYRQFRPFTNAQFPSKRAMDCFLQLYFEYFHPVFPILHKPTFDSIKTPWLLLLAAATIGCRYSKAPESGKGANALQEFLRRAIALTCEGDNSLVCEPWLAQSLILNSLGMTYSGDKRLLEISQAGRNFAITLCRRNGSMKPTYHVTSVSSSCHGAALEEKWRQWVREEARRRLGFSVWIIDCGLVIYLDYIPAMAADEPQQQLPCHEVLWSAASAEDWKNLVLKDQQQLYGCLPNVPAALRQLRQNHAVSSRLGDFARLIVTFAIYRCTQSMLQQARNPFMQPSHNIFNSAVEDDWIESSISALNSLLPTHSENADSSNDLLKSSLSCHIHLVSLLLYTPRNDLLAFSHTHRTDHEPSGKAPKHILTQWIRVDYGRKARRAVLHAGTLFRLLRKQSCQGLHEPITALLATLVIWAFNQLFTELETYPGQNISGGGERSSIRLDRTLSDDGISAWIEGREGLRGHLTDVGNICGQDAASRLLYVGGTVLRRMDTWALSQGLAAWLGKLRARTTAPAAPEASVGPPSSAIYSRLQA